MYPIKKLKDFNTSTINKPHLFWEPLPFFSRVNLRALEEKIEQITKKFVVQEEDISKMGLTLTIAMLLD